VFVCAGLGIVVALVTLLRSSGLRGASQ